LYDNAFTVLFPFPFTDLLSVVTPITLYETVLIPAKVSFILSTFVYIVLLFVHVPLV